VLKELSDPTILSNSAYASYPLSMVKKFPELHKNNESKDSVVAVVESEIILVK
jgi:hypothetical protein